MGEIADMTPYSDTFTASRPIAAEDQWIIDTGLLAAAKAFTAAERDLFTIKEE